jgi:hypothetical protein
MRRADKFKIRIAVPSSGTVGSSSKIARLFSIPDSVGVLAFAALRYDPDDDENRYDPDDDENDAALLPRTVTFGRDSKLARLRVVQSAEFIPTRFFLQVATRSLRVFRMTLEFN